MSIDELRVAIKHELKTIEEMITKRKQLLSATTSLLADDTANHARLRAALQALELPVEHEMPEGHHFLEYPE